MNIVLDPSFVDLFPEATIALVTGRVTGLREGFDQALAQLRETALAALKTKLSIDNMSEHAHIGAWRDAYRAFGVKAKKHKPTHESLARRLLRDGDWPTINPIVDVYLANQAEWIMPHGGYDLEKISGTIRLTRSTGGERFEPLGGGEEFTEPGEVVYTDAENVLTRRWNYRDCETTKITETTSEFVLMIESPSVRISLDAGQAAASSMVEKARACFDGEFQYSIVQARNQPQTVGG